MAGGLTVNSDQKELNVRGNSYTSTDNELTKLLPYYALIPGGYGIRLGLVNKISQKYAEPEIDVWGWFFVARKMNYVDSIIQPYIAFKDPVQLSECLLSIDINKTRF